MSKLYLTIYNKEKRFQYTKYFEVEYDMDKYIRRLQYIPYLILIEDSRDIYFYGKD